MSRCGRIFLIRQMSPSVRPRVGAGIGYRTKRYTNSDLSFEINVERHCVRGRVPSEQGRAAAWLAKCLAVEDQRARRDLAPRSCKPLGEILFHRDAILVIGDALVGHVRRTDA